MNSADAELWDWTRIFIGNVPPVFLLEVVFRVIIIYLILIVSMRMMGKRMSAMLSRNEMIAMVSLAAAVGIPIQDPERGMLPAVIIAGVVIGVQRFVSYNTMKNPNFESTMVGNTGPLVIDGRLQLGNMEKSKISRERMLTEFRVQEVYNLGKIQRVFMEANGSLSVYQFEEGTECDGLCILPSWDKEFLDEMEVSKGRYACGGCGHVIESEEKPRENCRFCRQVQWFEAIKS